MNLTLQRDSQTADCTQGTLFPVQASGGFVLQTLELPWVPSENQPGGMPEVSCVPAGRYDLALHDTVGHPKCFALVNPALGVIHEPDPAFPNARTACLIHIANFVEDLRGCIGVGIKRGDCNIWNSAVALATFDQGVPWVAGHTLDILDVPS